MASKTFYDCGCVEHGDQFFSCAAHKQPLPVPAVGGERPQEDLLAVLRDAQDMLQPSIQRGPANEKWIELMLRIDRVLSALPAVSEGPKPETYLFVRRGGFQDDSLFVRVEPHSSIVVLKDGTEIQSDHYTLEKCREHVASGSWIELTPLAGAVSEARPQPDLLDGEEVRSTLREWARQIRAAEDQQTLIAIADDMEANAPIRAGAKTLLGPAQDSSNG